MNMSQLFFIFVKSTLINLPLGMKKLTSIFILVLCCCAAAAQDNGAAKVKLNKKNLVVKEWNVSDGGSKILDQLTIFSAEGKKIEETEYDAAGRQKWRKRYEWEENGKVARELLYDGHNRLVNYKTFEYNEFGKKKSQYTYSPKGKLLKTKVYEYIVQDEQ